MGLEIERKFLVSNRDWQKQENGVLYRQGYLATADGQSIRIRIAGARAYLTIKKQIDDISRQEFEYSIPVEDANILLDQICIKPLIEKTRYHVEYGLHIWEIDEFSGRNQGLVIAEIELTHKDEKFERPGWLSKEVSNDPRYLNVNLQKKPFCEW